MDKLSEFDLNVIKSANAFLKTNGRDETRNLYVASLLDIIDKLLKDNWQPIKTAPKDKEFDGWGTIINDDGVIHHPEPIRHTECYWGKRDSAYVKPRTGWCSTSGHDGGSWGIVLTHWQPLSAPPKGE